MRIGIFGGTFNPPHNGHVSDAVAAVGELGLDKLIVVPSANPPHKAMPHGSPAAQRRFELAVAAFGSLPNTEVSDIEMRRNGVSYTVDTICQIKNEYPDAELFLVIGTDMLAAFKKWYRYDAILKDSALAVCLRTDNEEGTVEAAISELEYACGAKIVKVENEIVEVSSTRLRELLPMRKGRELVPSAVYSIIIRDGLYDAKPNFQWLRDEAYAMLNPRRIPHVAGCEQEAKRLAERWGADVDDARTAAILHDVTKRLKADEQLILCDEYGIIADDDERNSPSLLHAKTGAAIAAARFGVSKEIESAIFWHTTGRENMTLLQKIIYIADYIEPTRNFDGVEKLRELAYKDLDEALLLGFQMSIDDLLSRGIVPHERTRRAMLWLREHKQGDN